MLILMQYESLQQITISKAKIACAVEISAPTVILAHVVFHTKKQDSEKLKKCKVWNFPQ